jgi:hypothetical protein
MWRQYPHGCLEVGNVAETGQQQDSAIAVGDGPGEVLHPLLEPRRGAGRLRHAERSPLSLER